ncbi:MAG: hypothetical protein J0H19_15580 [Rhodospirillales bacterium]|nr:hypothetical protein [Rhodospirillales bacterium]
MTAKINKAPVVRYTSGFALIDIKSGRVSLSKLFGPNGYPKDGQTVRIPITIQGYITHRHSSDDGVSIEYGVEVESLQIEGGR